MTHTRIIRRKRLQHQRAFTLIEIMIVVVIIGLLAGLVAVNLIPQAEEAKRKAALAQMKSMEQALELYKLDTGQYPDSLQELVSPSSGRAAYLKGGKLPKDPWNKDFKFIVPGIDGQPYEIISYGSDGQPGGTGENADISNWGTSEGK